VSKKEFLNFWPYVKDSLGFNQGGIYHAKIIGGVKKKQPSLQVIMLDTRYFRSPLKRNPEVEKDPLKQYLPNTDPQATILGEQQWTWLEEQLARPADVRFIVSSIQVIPEQHGFEKWANFPKEKERLLNLLKKTQVKNVFILSGDRHLGIISKQEVKGYGPLYEITSSSINRPSKLEETDPSYIGKPIPSENFGLALIQWKNHKITFQLKNIKNETLNSVDVPIKLVH
jgi:alkaline phosphatase D